MKFWNLIKMVYSTILRPIVVKAIDNPDSEVDEFVLSVLDRIFEYNGDPK